MNVQSTKMELMKIIADINSDVLLERLKSWLLQQVKGKDASPQNESKAPKVDNAFIIKDGFLIFTGLLQTDFDALLEEERMMRDLSLM